MRAYSQKIIFRTMTQKGFGSGRPHRVPLFTARYRKIRLQFANANRTWSMEDWNQKHIIWSDELQFRFYPVDEKLQTTRSYGPILRSRGEVMQAVGGGVTVWGRFVYMCCPGAHFIR